MQKEIRDKIAEIRRARDMLNWERAHQNKIVVKDDAGNLDIVFCKTVGDAIRFYNLLSEWVLEKKMKKNILMLGDYSGIGDKRRALEKELVERTGWTIRKIQMCTSKKCKL